MASRWLMGLYQNRSIVTFLHDGLWAALSLVIALYLRVGGDILMPKYLGLLEVGVPTFTVIALVTYSFFGMYRGFWRYASVPDLITIVKANTLAILFFFPALFVLTRLEGMPRTVPVIQALILIMGLGGSRLVYRAARSKQWIVESREAIARIPVLVYGSGDEAEQFIRATKTHSIYKPVAVMDERRSRQGKTIHGVKIFGGARSLERILVKLKRKGLVPQKIIVADKSVIGLNSAVIRNLSDRAAKHGLTIVRLPKLAEMQQIDAGAPLALQPIAIEDLLGRPQIVMNREAIEKMLKGKRILITGAGGSIGSEIVMQVAAFSPASLCLLDNSEHNLYAIDMRVHEEGFKAPCDAILADVRDISRLDQIFSKFKPHVVFHAAAYKHVPMVEMNPSEGILTNVIGTRNVAQTAIKHGAAAMVQISTDKAVNPTNVMGATKKLAEMLCQALDVDSATTRFMTVRFGNVLGSSGSVVPLFKRQLERGGPLTVTDPRIERFFMTIPEAVGLVLSASAYGLGSTERGRIFVLDMGEPIKIDDLARQMIRLAGLEPDKDIKVVYTGLRPGEKLYEELFNSEEKPLETELPNIQAAEPAVPALSVLKNTVEKMEKAAQSGERIVALTLLKQVVPNFESQTAEAA